MNYFKALILLLLLTFCSTKVLAYSTVDNKITSNSQIIDDLSKIKALEMLNDDERKIMSQEIINSGLPYEAVKARLIRYCARKMVPFMALERAIAIEERSRLRKRLIAQVVKEDGHFIRTIRNLLMDYGNEEKVIKAYAICLYPLKSKEYRRKLSPKIGDPVNNYTSPRHLRSNNVPWRTRPAKHLDQEVAAYRILLAETKRVSETYNLNDFEKVTMAKCLAEQALKFFHPQHHLIKAAQETMRLYTRSPERAFFRENGVCTNFVAITYNIAQQLGLGDRIVVARRHAHTYLELNVAGHWYHSHPFSNVGYSDFNRFSLDEELENNI